jgi:AraC-like DNA-binding protein
VFVHVQAAAPPLDRFVEHITYYEDSRPEYRIERLVPDGAVQLVIDLGASPKKLYDRDDVGRARELRGAWLSGMHRRWILIEAAQGASMVVVRFRPGGAYPFFGTDVDALTDAVEPLDVVGCGPVEALRDCLIDPTCPLPTKMAAVQAWLVRLAGGRLAASPLVEHLARRLFAPGSLRIGALAAETGYSQRHLDGLFRRRVGLTPKQYARVRRFQRVLTHLVRGTPEPPPLEEAATPVVLPAVAPAWARLAAEHGYCDQPHLVREFQRLAGLSPTAYVAAFRGLESYLAEA